MPEYINAPTITRHDRAAVALDLKNAGQKDVNARTFVDNIKQQWGAGVSTLVVFYNASGDDIQLVQNHDYWGHIGPSPYPTLVRNGQWGAFLHVKTSGAASGSSAAVVYRGLDASGNSRDWCFAWDNPWSRAGDNNNKVPDQNQHAQSAAQQSKTCGLKLPACLTACQHNCGMRW
jgi:hypothetical protein